MGSNILNSLKDLLQKPVKLQIGTVVSSYENKSIVNLSSNVRITCWGTYSPGDAVYIKDGQILGTIKKEVPVVVYI